MPVTAGTPWISSLGQVPAHLEYFQGSMYQAVAEAAERQPTAIAFDFLGKSTSYSGMLRSIRQFAAALSALGVAPEDRVTIALPNCPQAVYALYAVNYLGAVANMIHPLSAEAEIVFFLNHAHSRIVITLDQFYDKFASVREQTGLQTILVTSLKDALSVPARLGYALTQGRSVRPVPRQPGVVLYKDLCASVRGGSVCAASVRARDPAVILYSGGTTGTTKGILLTNLNFNALGAQVIAANPMFRPGDRMLAAMPLFHGFGLGVCIHTMLQHGGRCVMVPRFTADSFAGLITRYRCSFIAGVPTLYEALLRLPGMKRADLSCLKGVFSGGDSLSTELKRKMDAFLAEHGASVQIREGYGTTETVTACCLTPPHTSRVGSIGLPFPDTYIKIVRPGTDEELPYGQEGEILLAGPTVMLGYADNPQETQKTLRTHADGLTWVYTGDLGVMDADGFIYFRGRAKRMIVTSGYNVYPAQIENILDANENVHMSCVIGVPDSYRMQAVKAFVVLRPGVPPTEATRQALLEYCRLRIARYALPRQIEFRDTLPTTLVGKVAYRRLEEESRAAAEKGPSACGNEPV